MSPIVSTLSDQDRVMPSPERIRGARVLVVGDVMLDRYWFGEVSRISPEAPVPVVHIQRSDERPGGAANVARNIAALGGQATLLSVAGRDEAAEKLASLLQEAGVHTQLHADASLNTTVKLRVIGRQQQLLRIDFESQPEHDALSRMWEDFASRVEAADVVVLSDYGKGVLQEVERMIALCREKNRPVLVDPKGDEYERYRHATLLTPNRSEFRQVAGRWKSEAELTDKAQALRRQLDLQGLLVTRSEEGMSLYTDAGVLHDPARALEVFDVSGAGDTVIGTLAVALAAGATLPQAVHTANRAAGIVVGKLGTAVVHAEELFGPDAAG